MDNKFLQHTWASAAVLFFILLVGCTASPVPANSPTRAVPRGITPDQSGTATSTQTLTQLPIPTAVIFPTAAVTAPDPGTLAAVMPGTGATAPAAAIPAEHYITQISGHKQYFSLGCETAAALDWARYLGYDFNEFQFQYDLPQSDNPELGFVGDVNAPWGQVPPYGYGVHAGPVADLLTRYKIPAKAYKNYTLDQLISKLAADKPVIAWVIGNVVGGVPDEYTDKAGNKVTVAAYEHVVILTGYNETKLRYMTNGKFYEVPKDVFLNSWGVLGNMVVADE
jgi:uncharacterized protein YvpB